MRLRKIDRYLLLLAGLFVLALLKRGDFPGEEVLPDVYRATVYQPLLARVAGAANGEAIDLVKLRAELSAKDLEISRLKRELTALTDLKEYFVTLHWERKPRALPGWVYAVDPNPFRRMFRIDVGSAGGARVGQPVVTGRALLGLVSATDRRVATVQRVDDPAFRLEVELRTADEELLLGWAKGDGDRGLIVGGLRRAGALKVGDSVYTTRYHELVPPGLVVGWVSAIEDLDGDGVPEEVVVEPAAALGRWAQVAVLRSTAPR